MLDSFEVTRKRSWEGEVRMSRRALRQKRLRKRRRSVVVELSITVLVAFVLVFGLVRPFAFEAFRIPTESMVPTLEAGDRVLANKFVYRFVEPERGDIVVFGSVNGEDETLIKRVVGVGGDEIQVQDGVLFVNGEPQEEPYLNKESPSRDFYGPVKVPEGHVFLMGDNRGNSSDSRVFGPVPLENLKGGAFFRFWPISKIGPI
jgi:signal peptidase I